MPANVTNLLTSLFLPQPMWPAATNGQVHSFASSGSGLRIPNVRPGPLFRDRVSRLSKLVLRHKLPAPTSAEAPAPQIRECLSAVHRLRQLGQISDHEVEMARRWCGFHDAPLPIFQRPRNITGPQSALCGG